MEPFLGVRPFLTVRAYESCVKNLLGGDVINDEKMKVEGETSERTLA